MAHSKEDIRKEVVLSPEVVKALQAQADAEGRSLKNYMEHILTLQSRKTSK